jgi:hypothetical protein
LSMLIANKMEPRPTENRDFSGICWFQNKSKFMKLKVLSQDIYIRTQYHNQHT